MSVELCLCLGLISISDIKEQKIPNSLVVAVYVIGILNLCAGRVSCVESSVGLLVLPVVMLVVRTITRAKLGMGDIKLISALGFCLGFWNQMIIILFGFSIALFKSKKDKIIILGPFISIGVLITLIIERIIVK